MAQASAEGRLDREQLHELAQQLRVDSVRAAAAANSGHPTSSMSAADLMAVLFTRYLRYDFDAPENKANDHLVFSKGHASPLLYSLYKLAGAIDDEELLTFREFGSRLQGHPTPEIPWVDVATGSLGQGLPISIGIALAGKRLEAADFRVWVLCGDSELAEGSMWEAFEHAGYAGLDNMIAIVDVNRLGQRGPTMHEWDTSSWRPAQPPAAGTCRRSTATTWRRSTPPTRGRSPPTARRRSSPAPRRAPALPRSRTSPTSTASRWPTPRRRSRSWAAIARSGSRCRRRPRRSPSRSRRAPVERPAYEVGEKVATRGAYGDALAWLGSIDERVVALDGEVGNSTYAERFAAKHPDRFFEMYIAEQQMVAAGVGLQTRGWKPFASSFGAFLSRAYDFVRMAAISDADLKLCGSHVGVSIGPDGPSQMALEDIASLRAVFGSVVLYPSDANQAVELLDAMRAAPRHQLHAHDPRGDAGALRGRTRTSRSAAAARVRSGDEDAVTLIGAGITLRECLTAADELAGKGIAARVIDLYSVKPVDAEAILAAAGETRALVTVEDHWAEGGIGETVAGVLAEAAAGTPLVRLAVSERPGSGPPAALLAAAGIDAAHIVAAAERAVRAEAPAVTTVADVLDRLGGHRSAPRPRLDGVKWSTSSASEATMQAAGVGAGAAPGGAGVLEALDVFFRRAVTSMCSNCRRGQRGAAGGAWVPCMEATVEVLLRAAASPQFALAERTRHQRRPGDRPSATRTPRAGPSWVMRARNTDHGVGERPDREGGKGDEGLDDDLAAEGTRSCLRVRWMTSLPSGTWKRHAYAAGGGSDLAPCGAALRGDHHSAMDDRAVGFAGGPAYARRARRVRTQQGRRCPWPSETFWCGGTFRKPDAAVSGSKVIKNLSPIVAGASRGNE